MALDPDSLTEAQADVIEKVTTNDLGLGELSAVFVDPGEAYVCSPVPLSMRQLSQMYLMTVAEEQRHTLPKHLRERCQAERWVEQRAVYQTKRVAARRDAILQTEAQVWAILGLEFHSKRIRQSWERWEMLSEYVSTELQKCELGDAMFSTALRDACKELNQLELTLSEFMPQLGLPERAKEFWQSKAGSRDDLINRIHERVNVAVGADKAGRVFELIDNSVGTEESDDE